MLTLTTTKIFLQITVCEIGKPVDDFHSRKDSLPSGESHFPIFMRGHRKDANILTELIVLNIQFNQIIFFI